MDWISRCVRKSTCPCSLSLSFPKGYTCHPLIVFDSWCCCSSLYVVGGCCATLWANVEMGTNTNKGTTHEHAHAYVERKLASMDEHGTNNNHDTTVPPILQTGSCVVAFSSPVSWTRFLNLLGIHSLYEAFEDANMLCGYGVRVLSFIIVIVICAPIDALNQS